MWVDDSERYDESAEDALTREAERVLVAESAMRIAQEVADEVAALEFESEASTTAPAWVNRGFSMLDDVLAYRGIPRKYHRQTDPTPDLSVAPWAILTSTSLPLGFDWHPRDMIKLRSVCYAFRGGLTTGAFCGQILRRLGIPLRYDVHPPHSLFELLCSVFDELKFVHSLRGVAAHAVGVDPDGRESENLCCVAGSYALNRYLLLDGQRIERPPIRAGFGGAAVSAAEQRRLDWAPGDIDVFVGCHGSPHSAKSIAAFRALVRHALDRSASVLRPARPSDRLALLELGVRPPRPSPIATTTDEYDALAHDVDARVASAMRGVRTTYDRRHVLDVLQSMEVPPALLDAVRRLPSRLGAHGAIRVVRAVEVRLESYERPPDHATPHWPAPSKINVIQYAAPAGRPVDALAVVRAFDLLPCMVAMRVDTSLRATFELPPEARDAIARRELRLSAHCFGPAGSAAADESVEMATIKQVRRIFRYMRRGFRLTARANR